MNPSTILVGPGSVVKIDDRFWCVKRFDSSDSVLVRNIESSVERVVKLGVISESFSKGLEGTQIDLATVDDVDWDKAIERMRSLSPLIGNPERTRAAVSEAAKSLEVSVATAYRYLEKIETYGTVTCLLRKVRTDKGTKTLNPLVERIVKSVIASDYLTTLRRSPTKALREIRRRCHHESLPLPSKSTLLRRIDEILPEERERKRNGRNAALDYRAERGQLPGVDRLNAIWQIDHTRFDVVIVDETDRIPVGNPWITLAIDVYSRMVVGWYVSLDPPGSLGTGICISRAILSKEQWLAKLGVAHPWPCQGKPRVIQADNAKEFRGNMLRNACQEHGFDMKFRKVKKPNYGAHIERILGTLLEEIHGLDGTTFSNPQEKGDYDSDGNATMTLDDLERWLANLILGLYHHRNHGALGIPPIQKYAHGILGDNSTPGIGILPISADPEKLRIDFLPFETRTIQPGGVVLDYIEYQSPVLDKWIGALDPETRKLKRKFVFRRDPRDISYLIFWDPDVKRYYQIPYKNAARPAISLWELRAINRFLESKGNTELNEAAIFKALDEMRRIEDSARTLTRKQRMTKERRKQHVKVATNPPTSSNFIESNATPTIASKPTDKKLGNQLDLSDVAPFDEIEPN